MKKSKIIIPALAVLTLSTAAAVSGTVAWFSASRTATVTANSTVINPEGALKINVNAVSATEVTDNVVSLQSGYALRDASVDVTGITSASSLAGIKLHKAVLNDTGAITSWNNYTDFAKTETALGKKAGDASATSYTVYYCAVWTVEFSLPNNPTSSTYDLFFDGSKSEMTTNSAIAGAYRVAMITDTETTGVTNYAVWAPKHPGASLDYVNDTTAASTGTPEYAKYAGVKAEKVTEASKKSVAQASDQFLGSFAGGGAIVTVTFVAWYEGADAAAIESNLAAGAVEMTTNTLAFNAIDESSYAAE